MTPDRLRQAEQMFTDLAAKGAAERAEAIAAHCDGDDELRREVESLLAHHDASEAFLDQAEIAAMWTEGVLEAVRGEDSLPPCLTAGGYTLQRIIGSGGMGVVYAAEQERPRRTVALKVIRRGHGGESLVRRFEREAELLGRFQHPGIAQIFEAGIADFGHGAQPFIAMEFIDGPPLTEHAQKLGLDTRMRSELMIRVCDAVQHAHQRGVIHRDLKPANILVIPEEAAAWGEGSRAGAAAAPAGQPKILDFGVARATDTRHGVTSLNTGMGQLIGTLPYMSPEQVGGHPEQVDTRADVYALGVILYELLTAKLPHDLPWDRHRLSARAGRALAGAGHADIAESNLRFRILRDP